MGREEEKEGQGFEGGGGEMEKSVASKDTVDLEIGELIAIERQISVVNFFKIKSRDYV